MATRAVLLSLVLGVGAVGAAEPLRSDACLKALDGKPNALKVTRVCSELYSGTVKKVWMAIQGAPANLQPVLLTQGFLEEYCPKLKDKAPKSCSLTGADKSKDILGTLNELNAAALQLELGEKEGAAVAKKMGGAWAALFNLPAGK